jgi:hypothetical protein
MRAKERWGKECQGRGTAEAHWSTKLGHEYRGYAIFMSRGRRATEQPRRAYLETTLRKTPATWRETNVDQSIHPCLDQFAPQGSTRRGTTFGRRRAPPPALGAPSLCSVDALALQMKVAKVGRNLASYLACTYSTASFWNRRHEQITHGRAVHILSEDVTVQAGSLS